MNKKYNFNDEDIAKMISMYQDYQPIYKIAELFNVDDSVIKNRLNSNGVKTPKGSPYSYNYWLERGMDKDKINYHLRTIKPCFIEYWISKGYTEDDAILQVEGQKLVSLKGCIARYGKEEGEKKWVERKELRSKNAKLGPTNIGYWIKLGFNENEAKIKLSERQKTFSLDKCIEIHGDNDGRRIFTNRQNKWQKSLNDNNNLKKGYSKISQELFYKILDLYRIDERNDVFFATKNGEYRLDKTDGGVYIYDFTDIKNKKIIEFNGDLYHANPKKYLEGDTPHPFRKNITAKEIWDKDDKKIEYAKKNGFEVLIIWDSEYRWGNKNKIINKCIEFIKK